MWGFVHLIDNNEVRRLKIDDNRFTLSDNFYIKDINNNIIAEIDGKALNIGGKYEIKIYDKDLVKEKLFYQTIILFAAVIEFLDGVEAHLKLIMARMKKGEKLKLSHHEQEFYLNPRRRRS